MALLWAAMLAPALHAQPSAALETQEQRELDHLLEDLKDTGRDATHRSRAAAILLDRGWPPANREVRRLLIHSEDPSTQAAIARGIADAQTADAKMIQPLLALLGSEDAAMRSDIAAALGRFDPPSLVSLLAATADDPGVESPRRLGAVQALSHHRTRGATGPLVEVVSREGEDPAVRDAAFEALVHLTGIDGHGHDAQAWQRWWARAKELDDRAWDAELMRHIARRGQDQAQKAATLTTRLTEAQTQVYDATAEEGRPAILQRMLTDDLPEVRLKALKLVEQRLLNAQKVTDPTRAATRELLTDPSMPVRTQAALVLESLADEPAARQAADLLSSEPDPGVQAAYLRLLARVPQDQAVAPALRLFEVPAVRTAAAAYLIVAFDKQLLTPEQVEGALQATRLCVSSEQAIHPTTLQLLGRLGHEEDQVLVLPFLQGADTPLRVAAVNAFGNERWPLMPLMGYLEDPTLRAAVWKLIGKRGRTAEVLTELLDGEPVEADAKKEWSAVIATVAARLEMADLVKVDGALRPQPDRRPIHEAVLMAACGLAMDGTPIPAANGAASTTPEPRVEAELLLGEFYLRHREAGKAKAVYTRLAGRTSLTVEQKHRVSLGSLERMLQQQALDEAAEHTLSLIGALQVPPTDRLARLWLDAAEEALPSDSAQATLITAKVDTLFAGKLDAASQTRLSDVKKKLPAPSASAPERS